MSDLGNAVLNHVSDTPFLPNGGGADLLCILTDVFPADGAGRPMKTGQVRLVSTGEVLFVTDPMEMGKALAECRAWAEENVVRWKVTDACYPSVRRQFPVSYWRKVMETMLVKAGLPSDPATVDCHMEILRAVGNFGIPRFGG